MTLTLFGPAWALVLLLLLTTGVVTHLALRDRDVLAKRRGLVVLAVATVIASATFHLDYLADRAEHFPLWQNLPLHLCTIVSFLLLPAVVYDARPLRALVYYPGALAGFLALFSAAPMYFGYDLASPKTAFFLAHGLNAVVPTLMATLGVYRPTARDAVRSVGYLLALALAVLPVTLLLRAVADPQANYMFVFGPQGAGILELFHDLIPVPLLYQIPLLVIIVPVLLVQWAAFRGFERLTARRRGAPGAAGTPLRAPGLTPETLIPSERATLKALM